MVKCSIKPCQLPFNHISLLLKLDLTCGFSINTKSFSYMYILYTIYFFNFLFDRYVLNSTVNKLISTNISALSIYQFSYTSNMVFHFQITSNLRIKVDDLWGNQVNAVAFCQIKK